MTRLSIDISDDLHKLLKIHTAYKKDTIMNYVREAIYSKIAKEQELNATSIKALRESAQGTNVNKHSSYKAMYKKLKLI